MTQLRFSLFLLALTLLCVPAFAATQSGGISQDYANILENRIQALEDQMTRLTNQVEQANNQAQQAQARLAKVEEDMNTRFRMMEDQAAQTNTSPASESTSAPKKAPVDSNEGTAPPDDAKRLGQLTTDEEGTPVSPDGQATDPNTAYDTAFSKIRDGDYEAAEAGMRDFIKRWPRHELASNASYWLGESFYARGDYEHAAKSFAESYKKYPRGAKAEDTLLKLGLTLSSLNRTNDACVAFEQVEAEFPNLSSANRRRMEQERTQIDCPKSGGSSENDAPAAGTTSHKKGH